MTRSTDPWVAQPGVTQMEGDAALPRWNGELVFDYPWQGRVFGLAVSLVEQRGYDWEDFRELLIAQIAKSPSEEMEPVYYEHWLAALEELAISKRLTTKEELDIKTQQITDNKGEEWTW